MHRVKGLEFDRVIIAGVNDGIVPLEDAVNSSSDTAIQTELDIQEKALLYVAATRAKKKFSSQASEKGADFYTESSFDEHEGRHALKSSRKIR